MRQSTKIQRRNGDQFTPRIQTSIQGIATCSFQCSCLERTFCVFCFGCKSIPWFGLPTMQSGSLTLGSRFNQSVHHLSLPKNLESLTFGEEFQQPLDGGKLPATLQHLTFGSKFNQSLAMVPWTPWCDMANWTFPMFQKEICRDSWWIFVPILYCRIYSKKLYLKRMGSDRFFCWS